METSNACGWNCGDTEPGHKHYTVIVRENGKLLGRLTPNGGTTTRKVYASILSHKRATEIADELNNGNGLVSGLSAVVRVF